MGRIKEYYFDQLTSEDNEMYNDLLENFNYELPTEKELRKVEKLVKKTQRAEYAELTGVDPDLDL